MVVPGKKRKHVWTDKLRGTYGDFTTTGPHRLSYLTTRISIEELKQLKTARQVFDRGILRIRELMQRDIDDERIRTDIVPYLTPSLKTEARFFPPLVIAVMAKSSSPGLKKPSKLYPRLELTKDHKLPHVYDPEDELEYLERIYGSAFGVRIPMLSQDELIYHGSEFVWNRDAVDLMVIDGQHRLLALKAIAGILDPDEYVRGYHDTKLPVKELEKLGLSSVAVTIVFPPELHQGNTKIGQLDDVITVFRKIFVDVNKKAKSVAMSRNILLDESDLIAVFTRNIVDAFAPEAELPGRNKIEGNLPLYAFEWDSPEKKESQITDWRAVSSVGLMYQLVEALLLGPSKDEEEFRNKLGIEEGDDELDPDLVNHTGFSPAMVSPSQFTNWQRVVLENRFCELWQPAIVILISQLFPASKLLDALEQKRIELELELAKQPSSRVSRFAKEYLVGTRADRKHLEHVAGTFETEIGGYDPGSCETAINDIKRFQKDTVEIIRTSPFGRLFFSNLGQTEIFLLVFSSLLDNLSEGNDTVELAEAFCEGFNSTFAEHSGVERLFDDTQPWNELTISTLGTQSWRHEHVSGLLRVSFCLWGENSKLEGMFGEKWEKVRLHMYTKGIESIRDSLKSRLPYQFRHDIRVTQLADESAKRKKKEELVDKRATEILNELNRFIDDNASNPPPLFPGRID